jgi:hypothetical protein
VVEHLTRNPRDEGFVSWHWLHNKVWPLVNLVTPKAGAKHEYLFYKLAPLSLSEWSSLRCLSGNIKINLKKNLPGTNPFCFFSEAKTSFITLTPVVSHQSDEGTSNPSQLLLAEGQARWNLKRCSPKKRKFCLDHSINKDVKAKD